MLYDGTRPYSYMQHGHIKTDLEMLMEAIKYSSAVLMTSPAYAIEHS